MATQQDTYSDTSKISSQIASEVSGGVLQNKYKGGSSSLFFDGVDDMAIASVSDYRSSDQSGSIGVLFKVSNTSFFVHLYGSGDTGSLTRYIFFGITDTGFLRMTENNNGTQDAVHGHEKVNDGKWHRGIVTCNGSTWKLYVDGVQQILTTTIGANNGDWFGDVSSLDNLSVSILRRTNDTQFLHGYMKEAFYWNRVLTDDEIRQWSVEGADISSFSNYSTECINHYEFDDASGTTLTDSKGLLNLTITGATWDTSLNVYMPLSQTISTSKMGASSVLLVSSFKYTNSQKTGDSRVVYQFSDDNSTWKNSAGKAVKNISCVNFDGVNDYITESVSGYRGSDSAGTVIIWFKTKADSTLISQQMFSSSDMASDSRYITFGIYQNKLDCQQRNNDTASAIQGSMIVNDGQWHQAAFVSTGSAYLIYVDGILQSLTARTGSNNGDWFSDTSNRDNWVIGALIRNTTSNYFSGLIDNISIYNTNLSQADIVSLFRSDTVPSDYGSAVSWWKLDDNTGTSATDSIGSNTGTLTNGPVWISDWWRLHHHGDAVEDFDSLYFDGNGDYVELANESNFDFLTANNPTYTICAWIKTQTPTTTQNIVSKGHSVVGDANYGFTLSVTTGGVIQVRHVSSLGVFVGVNGNTRVDNGRWRFVVVRANASNTAEILIDGVLDTSAPVSGGSYSGINNGASVRFGRTTDTGNLAEFLGKMANVAIFNDYRTNAEVLADFQNGYYDTSDANMVSGFALDEGSGTTATDVKGSNAGTINGSAQWVKDEYRPIPDVPVQQTIDLSGVGSSWTDFYYREYRENA